MLQVHHIALTAEDLSTTVPFYDKLLAIFGYKRQSSNDRVHSWIPPKGSENMPEFLIYATKPEQKKNKHIIYDPGVHHYCFCIDKKEQVDRVFEVVTTIGGEILNAPTDYPSYAKNVKSERYYAVCINDPNGIKLEFAWMPK